MTPLTLNTVSERGRLRTGDAALMALSGFVAVRSLVLLWLVVTANETGRRGDRLLTKWDAQWYGGIADSGYGFVRTHEDGRLLADYAFFPLYPWTERLVTTVTGLSHVDAGVLISAVAALFAAAGIFRVANDVLGPRGAVIATVLWAAVPVGIVQSMAYSESLFTALAAWSLFGLLRERWLLAATLACAAGLTRPTGVAIVTAVLVTAVISLVAHVRRKGAPRARILLDRRLVSVIVAPLGLVGYLGWVGWERRSPTGYFEVSDGWGNGFDGGAAFARWVAAQLAGPTPITGVVLLVGLGLLAFLVAQCIRQRQPLPLVVFTIVIVVLALTTSGFFGSRPRHLLPAFPLLFPVAQWLAARRTAVTVAALMATSAAAAFYGATWLLGPGPP